MSGTLLKRFNQINTWPGPVTFRGTDPLRFRPISATRETICPQREGRGSCHRSHRADSVIPITFIESFQ
jgi:hypothetical protein